MTNLTHQRYFFLLFLFKMAWIHDYVDEWQVNAATESLMTLISPEIRAPMLTVLLPPLQVSDEELSGNGYL